MYAGRRTVLTAGAAGAAGLVTACGSSGDGSGRAASTPETSRGATPSTRAGAASTEGSVPGGEALAKTSDIPVGGGKVFGEQEVVVTQPKEGEFKGFSAICTHKGAPSSQSAMAPSTAPATAVGTASRMLRSWPAPRRSRWLPNGSPSPVTPFGLGDALGVGELTDFCVTYCLVVAARCHGV